MTFADLFAALETRGALRRAAVKKSYLKTLALALGSPSLEACVVETAYREEATWLGRLEDYFDARTEAGHPVSAYTRRNTKSDLRGLFRLADECGLLPAPLPPLLLKATTRQAFARELGTTSPYKHTHSAERYSLRQADWPPDIQAGWQAYRRACGRRIRETTMAAYTTNLQHYFGYLRTIRKRQPAWEDLFDVAHLNAFVSWHGERMGQDVSAHGWHTVIGAAAMAAVLHHPRAGEILAFSRTVERPPVLHRKRLYHWVPLKRLDEIANACLAEGRRPYLSHTRVRSPGVRGATRFQRGLMLKLLTRIPMRSRNLREMRLGTNLLQDREGHWLLEFRGNQLKVAKRAGRTNEYLFDLTLHCPPEHDDLLATLEEFLTVYRPRLPNSTPDGFVFLTQLGTPYDGAGVHKELATIVARYTGQRFFPHLIRTIWGSEYLDDHPGDFTTVAEMLGNTVPVVIKTYYDIQPKAQQAKASAWTRAKFGGGALTREPLPGASPRARAPAWSPRG